MGNNPELVEALGSLITQVPNVLAGATVKIIGREGTGGSPVPKKKDETEIKPGISARDTASLAKVKVLRRDRLGQKRDNLNKIFQTIVGVVAVCFSAFYFYTAGFGILSSESHRGSICWSLFCLAFCFTRPVRNTRKVKSCTWWTRDFGCHGVFISTLLDVAI